MAQDSIRDPEDLPSDNRIVHIISDDGKAHEAVWSSEHRYWTGDDAWYCACGEPRLWHRDEIIGWSESPIGDEDAASFATMADMLAGMA